MVHKYTTSSLIILHPTNASLIYTENTLLSFNQNFHSKNLSHKSQNIHINHLTNSKFLLLIKTLFLSITSANSHILCYDIKIKYPNQLLNSTHFFTCIIHHCHTSTTLTHMYPLASHKMIQTLSLSNIHIHSFIHSLSLSHTHTQSLTLPHSQTYTCIHALTFSLSLSHTHTYTHTRTHTHPNPPTDTHTHFTLLSRLCLSLIG